MPSLRHVTRVVRMEIGISFDLEIETKMVESTSMNKEGKVIQTVELS